MAIHRMTAAERRRVGEVFDRHRRFVETIASRFVPPDVVADITQAVFLKVCGGMNGFREDAELTTWLFRIAKNEAMNHYRQEQSLARIRANRQNRPDPDQVLDPDEQVTFRERAAALYGAVGVLNPRHRGLFQNLMTDPAVLPGSKTTRHAMRQELREALTRDPRLK